jgi:hypothetical protein
MYNCDWCGHPFEVGEAWCTTMSPLLFGNSTGIDIEVTPEYELKFCCMGCYWAFSVDFHRILGMSPKEARKHVIETCDIEPSKANGKQSASAWLRSKNYAEQIARVMFGYQANQN